jgi:hypothetical protein
MKIIGRFPNWKQRASLIDQTTIGYNTVLSTLLVGYLTALAVAKLHSLEQMTDR